MYRRSIKQNGVHYTDPDVLRMMMYLELSRPKGDVDRWPKVFERLQLINQLFPIRGCSKTPEQKGRIPFTIRSTILNYIVEWQRIICNGPVTPLYKQGIKKQNAVFRIQEGGAVLFTSPDPKIDAMTLKKNLGESSIKILRHRARGEIVPERFELVLHGNTLCVIVQETACHSYYPLPLADGRKIYIGSLEFLITLYLSLSIFTTHSDDILGKSVLCQVNQFIQLSEENSRAKKSQFTPFALQCRGHQVGFVSLLRDKVRRVKLERGDDSTRRTTRRKRRDKK
jgi:hypothetical protein